MLARKKLGDGIPGKERAWEKPRARSMPEKKSRLSEDGAKCEQGQQATERPGEAGNDCTWFLLF